jgi:hypothetical protein
MKTILSRKRKGKANPKKAGIQNSKGEIYLAITPVSKQRMRR